MFKNLFLNPREYKTSRARIHSWTNTMQHLLRHFVTEDDWAAFEDYLDAANPPPFEERFESFGPPPTADAPVVYSERFEAFGPPPFEERFESFGPPVSTEDLEAVQGLVALLELLLREEPPRARVIFPDLSTQPPVPHYDDCPICLETFRQGEEQYSTRCAHTFHATCLRSWAERRPTCPTCRAAFPVEE